MLSLKNLAREGLKEGGFVQRRISVYIGLGCEIIWLFFTQSQILVALCYVDYKKKIHKILLIMLKH